jgi:peptidoglycan/LPS O-acetylase OafA/YrhL
MQENITITNRLNGLDTLRAFAIIIVLLYHYMVVVSKENTFGYATQIGWMGVDLFFVLSGYLIGNQVLSAITQRENFSLKVFYIRRLLRTLPNYYVVLSMYYIFPIALSGLTTASIWNFLTFTQNFTFRPFATFSHSWSLCIEEQFYLIFPLIFLSLAKSRNFLKLAWLTIIIGMLLGLSARIYAWYNYGESSMDFRDYYQHIYYSTLARFDELLPGIAIAIVKNFHPNLFEKILKKPNLVLYSGVFIIGIMFYLFPNYHSTTENGYNLLLSTTGYSFVAIGFALIIFSALSTESLIGKIRIPGAAQIALWSYAIYLIHKPVFQLLISPLTEMNIDVKSPVGVFIIFILSILAGWLLFKFVETPFMNIRGKYFPSNIEKVSLNIKCTQQGTAAT